MEDPFRDFRAFFGGLDEDDDDPGFGGTFRFGGDLFRRMDELMKDMMTFDGEGGGAAFQSDTPDGDRSYGLGLRDRMLKDPNDPFWKREYRSTEKRGEEKLSDPLQSFGRRKSYRFPSLFDDRRPFSDITAGHTPDQDLDASIAADPSQLDYLLKQKRESDHHPLSTDEVESPTANFHRSSFSSVSISTKRLPDGSFEKRETRRDSQGNETVTVTHSDGNETHAVTTRRYPGSEEDSVSWDGRAGVPHAPNDRVKPDQEDSSSRVSEKPSTIIRRFWNSIWSS